MLKKCFCGVAVEAGWKRWRRLTSGQGGIGGNIAAAAAAAAAASAAAVEQRALFQKNKLLPGRVENFVPVSKGGLETVETVERGTHTAIRFYS
jgi:hypothetical protein